MKAFNGYDSTERQQKFTAERLPAGGYVCKILGAKVDKVGNGEQLKVMFDICEGDYKGYYDAKYKEQSKFGDAKYKGILSYWIPTDDRSDKDEKTKSRFKSFFCDVEDSNAGYTWDWNEKKLKGKLVGILVHEEEYNGNTFTRAYQSETVDNVRNGKFKIWQPALKTAAPVTPEEDDEDELPFF